MKLLICTQAVDIHDPILGFFHGWLLEFAKHFEHIHVICLREGAHALPPNVTVYSLGKETGESRLKYITRFYGYLRMLRGAYDRVFVHMNPHYVLLGGILWKMRGIPIFFWRNHARMNLMTRIAASFARKVFYTSPYACLSKYHHAIQMPVGIDLTLFTMSVAPQHAKPRVLFLGRLSPVKRVEICIEAAALLGDACSFHVYGDAPRKDEAYAKKLRETAASNIVFYPGVANRETPSVYKAHDMYVNLTPDGSMDKTVLEAAACGTMAIVTNASFRGILDESAVLKEATPQALRDAIMRQTKLPESEKAEQRAHAYAAVKENHSLEKLGVLLRAYLE
jgi:glycosyltransferase involved in cell wall biosynthesis